MAPELALLRGIERDAARLGRAEAEADVVIDNADFDTPLINGE